MFLIGNALGLQLDLHSQRGSVSPKASVLSVESASVRVLWSLAPSVFGGLLCLGLCRYPLTIGSP